MRRCRTYKTAVSRKRCILENRRKQRLYEAELKKAKKK